jgi:hypothetical protein
MRRGVHRFGDEDGDSEPSVTDEDDDVAVGFGLRA